MKKLTIIVFALMLVIPAALKGAVKDEIIVRTLFENERITGITCNTITNITVIKSDVSKVEIEISEGLMEHLDISLSKEGMLTVEYDKNISKNSAWHNENRNQKWVTIRETGKSKKFTGEDSHVKVYLPDVKEIAGSLNSKITIQDFRLNNIKVTLSGAAFFEGSKIEAGNLRIHTSGSAIAKITAATGSAEIKASGSSKIDGVLECKNTVSMETSGSSIITLGGSVDNIEVAASGSSGINTLDMESFYAKADASGSSSIRIKVSKNLEAKASGAALIEYTGEAVVSRDRATGSSRIRKRY